MHEFSAIHSKLDQKQQSRGRKSTVGKSTVTAAPRIKKAPGSADAMTNAGKPCASHMAAGRHRLGSQPAASSFGFYRTPS
jgi:hypothetical protein